MTLYGTFVNVAWAHWWLLQNACCPGHAAQGMQQIAYQVAIDAITGPDAHVPVQLVFEEVPLGRLF